MEKVRSSIKLILIAMLFFLILAGCSYKGYRGDHQALYTEAIHSILAIQGYYDSHSLADPEIEIIETDIYGKMLYTYRENSTFALLVAQIFDEEYVYYYEDFNFIVADHERGEYPKEPFFTDEEIEDLKKQNDFNKEFDLGKCIRKEITNKKSSPTLPKNIEKELKLLCIDFAKASGCKGEDSVFRYVKFCTFDDYGRMLFYVYGLHRDMYGYGIGSDSTITRYFDMVIIFNSDWSYDAENCLLELTDICHYQKELKRFKQYHQWNQFL